MNPLPPSPSSSKDVFLHPGRILWFGSDDRMYEATELEDGTYRIDHMAPLPGDAMPPHPVITREELVGLVGEWEEPDA